MASLLSRESVCRKDDCSLIDIGTVYRVIASFWFIESDWKPDQLFEFPASKETSGKQRKFRQNIVEVKQTGMLSVMADEAADVSNKENLPLSSAMSTLERMLERSFMISAIVEKKQLVTNQAVNN